MAEENDIHSQLPHRTFVSESQEKCIIIHRETNLLLEWKFIVEPAWKLNRWIENIKISYLVKRILIWKAVKNHRVVVFTTIITKKEKKENKQIGN